MTENENIADEALGALFLAAKRAAKKLKKKERDETKAVLKYGTSDPLLLLPKDAVSIREAFRANRKELGIVDEREMAFSRDGEPVSGEEKLISGAVYAAVPAAGEKGR